MTWRGSHNTALPAQLTTRSIGWPRRLLLGALAVIGTVAHAASFRTLPPDQAGAMGPAAGAIGAAAALSWLVFGCLLLIARAGPSPMAWADACLRAMAAGVAALACGAALNLGAAALGGAGLGFLAAAHVALLSAGNVLMACVFCREARRRGVRPAAAVTAWLCGLDGVFVLILLSLYRNGAFVP